MAIIDGLVSYWKLDDNSDTNVVLDAHGDNPGTVVNDQNNYSSEQSTGTAKIVRAFALDGDNDYVNVADNPSFNITDNLSVFVWMKEDILERSTFLVDKYATDKREWALRKGEGAGNEDEIEITFGDASGDFLGGWQTTTSTIAATGTWYHVGFTFSSGTVIIYINGVARTSEVSRGSVPAVLYNGDAPVRIGQGGTGQDNPFDGTIDEVGIWNRVLDTDEITALYNGGSGLAYPFEVPPLSLSGLIAAQSTVTGDVDSIKVLQGSLTGQSISSAEIKSTKVITGLSEGQSGVTGNLQWLQELAGSVGAQSSSAGNIISAKILAGLIEAQSSVAGDIIVAGIFSLGGSIAAQATLTAELKEISSLSGLIEAQSSAVGNIIIVTPFLSLGGLIAAQSNVPQALLKATKGLSGSISAEAVLSGDIFAIKELVGLIAAQSDVLPAGLTPEIPVILFPTLIAKPSVSDFTQEAEDFVDRSRPGDGMLLQKTRTLAGPILYRVRYSLMSNTDKEKLETWERDECSYGGRRFKWIHPSTGKTYVAILLNPISYTIHPRSKGDIWRIYIRVATIYEAL